MIRWIINFLISLLPGTPLTTIHNDNGGLAMRKSWQTLGNCQGEVQKLGKPEASDLLN